MFTGEPTSTAPRKGKGARCERPGCEREATRFPGAWRCETCPDPVQPVIAAEFDPDGKDPRKRHRWARYGGKNTPSYDHELEESA